MENKVKYTMVKMKHPQGDFYWMFHNQEGMLIGSVAGGGAKFGEDPNLALQRLFISDEAAIAWVKKKCQEVCMEFKIEWQEQDDTPGKIVLGAFAGVGNRRN